MSPQGGLVSPPDILRMAHNALKCGEGGEAPRRHHGTTLGVPRTHGWHTSTQTHGLHDMCGVHPVATTAQGLVRPTSFPSWHEGTQRLV